jgi:signal transduction histidine kinase
VVVALQLLAGDATDAEGKRLIAEAVSETRQAIEDPRELGAGLHPSVLTHRGLRAAINPLTARAPAPVTLEIAAERFAPMSRRASRRRQA